MKSVPVSRLSNDALLKELAESIAQDCPRTARQVALIGEVERRRLYAPAGYPSMFAYCIGELRLSEDAALKRLRVARAARRHPSVLSALAEGRVHLSGLTLLAHYINPAAKEAALLAPAAVDDLLTAATYKSKREIEHLLAERFPKPDVRAEIRPLAPARLTTSAPPRLIQVSSEGPELPQAVANTEGELAPGPVRGPVILGQQPTAPEVAAERARVAPLSPQRFGVQFTLDQAGHDLLRYVQDLLGNRVAPGDLAEVFVQALELLAARLEKQKFAATERPVAQSRPIDPESRHVSADVKREVWERDGGRCTYVSESGKRCESRWDLEYDHVLEYARGGDASASNIRLRCRAHNQDAAERTFGVAFMQHKREKAAEARAVPRAGLAAATAIGGGLPDNGCSPGGG